MRIQVTHQIFLNLEELRDTLAELLQFLRNVEEQARRRQDLISLLEREIQPPS